MRFWGLAAAGAAGFGTLACGAGAQQPAGEPVEMSVAADEPGATIDRHIFGQFAEHLGYGIYGGVWVGPDSQIPNVRGIRSDVVGALRALKVPNVRWPGGCFADEYHWRDGIGGPEARRATTNANWGDAGEPNTFGTDEFMDFVDQIGSEAYLSVNVGSGTVGEAADWLAYMTAPAATAAGHDRAANGHAEPYKVRFLGLGNESWSCGGAMRPVYYTDLMKRFARFVRNYRPEQMAAGEEPMQRIAVGPGDESTDYTEAVMQAWKSHDWAWSIEGISLHRYTTGGWPPSYPSTDFDTGAYARLVAETLTMDDFIARNSAVMDKYDPAKEVFLSVDEWGVWLAPEPDTNPGFLIQQNTMRDAVIAALNLNIFARHADRVKVANIAQMANVLQAMILTDGDRMVLTPTYHVFRMYVPFQDATFVPVSLDAGEVRVGDVALPRLDAIAARDSHGRLWLAVTNLDPEQSARVAARIEGAAPIGASGEELTAERVDSHNTFENPEVVTPRAAAAEVRGGMVMLDLPAKSVTVLQIAQ